MGVRGRVLNVGCLGAGGAGGGESDTNHETSGYLVETTDPKLLEFDSVLLGSATLDVEIGVTHHRAPGAAWGQYAVLFVIVDHGAPTKMAQALEHTAHALSSLRTASSA